MASQIIIDDSSMNLSKVSRRSRWDETKPAASQLHGRVCQGLGEYSATMEYLTNLEDAVVEMKDSTGNMQALLCAAAAACVRPTCIRSSTSVCLRPSHCTYLTPIDSETSCNDYILFPPPYLATFILLHRSCTCPLPIRTYPPDM